MYLFKKMMVGDRKGRGLRGLQGLNLGIASHLPRSNSLETRRSSLPPSSRLPRSRNAQRGRPWGAKQRGPLGRREPPLRPRAWSAPRGSPSSRRTRTTHGDQLECPSAFPWLPRRAGSRGIAAPSPRPARLASPAPTWTQEVAARQGPGPSPGAELARAGRELGGAAGPGSRGLGLCRPVEPTPSSRPQRPSPQLPPVLLFGVRGAGAPQTVSLGLGPAKTPARYSTHALGRGSGFPPSGVPRRRHPPRPTPAAGLRNQPWKGYTTKLGVRQLPGPPRPPRTGQGERLGELRGPGHPTPSSPAAQRARELRQELRQDPTPQREAQLHAASLPALRSQGRRA